MSTQADIAAPAAPKAASVRAAVRPGDPIREAAHRYVQAVLALTAVGLVAVGTAGAARHGSPWPLVGKQAVMAALGLVGMTVATLMPARTWRRLAGPLTVVVLVLLAATLTFGVSVNGARRWLMLGPVRMQPSELAKVAVILFCASWAVSRPDDLKAGASLRSGPLFVLATLVALTAAAPDFGTALFLTCIAGGVLLVGGLSLRRVAGAVLFGVVPLAAVMITCFGHVRERLTTFLRPEADLQGAGHQVHQSLLAFGSGGMTGLGLGDGRQKLKFLPAHDTDFILPVLGEEVGLLGTVGVLLLFAAVLWQGDRLAGLVRQGFAFLVIVGVTLCIGVQALVNIAVVTASAPTKGIGLPFVSAGGSSLVVFLTMTGLVASMARSEARALDAAAGVGPPAGRDPDGAQA